MNKKNIPKPVKDEQPYLREVQKFPLRLAAARTKLLVDRPYYAAIVLSLQGPYETNRMPMPTIGVDKWARLYYHPEFVENTSIDELVGALVHELQHLLRNHPDRMERMANEEWHAGKQMLANVASDIEMNPSIVADGLSLPDFACFPKTFNLPENLIAEQYYDLLSKEAVKCRSDCGSCADGRSREHEFGGPGQPATKPGEAENPPGIGKVERQLINRKVADDVEAHAAKHPGTVPGWLRRWADGVRNPKVPWQEVLRATIRHGIEQIRGNTDYSYSRRSRRQDALRDVVLPGTYRPVPRVALLVDTSGSMTNEMLSQGLGEVKGVLQALGGAASLEVMCVDAAVQSRQTVFDVRKVQLLGGGGTILETGIEEIEKKRPRPQLLIMYTDGWCSWDREPKGMQTIVVKTDPSTSFPPWGRHISVDVKEKSL